MKQVAENGVHYNGKRRERAGGQLTTVHACKLVWLYSERPLLG